VEDEVHAEDEAVGLDQSGSEHFESG